MPAISDTSPLVFLSEIKQLHLLKDLSDTILIPDVVRMELTAVGTRPIPVPIVLEIAWIQERVVDDTTLSLLRTQSLHPGEAAVIALAMASGAFNQVILDDRRARLEAERHGIPTIGTGGVLVLAKHFGLIDHVRPLLDDLRDVGLYLGDSINTRLLQRANEL